MTKALALISGSLDSEVAAALVKQAGAELTCAEFACPFQHRTGTASSAARLESPLIGLEPDGSFLDIVRRPRFNFGGGPLSCLECRVRMLHIANHKRQEIAADLLVTGEVLGQRASNQSRRQLDLITYHSGAEDVLVRPLSTGLLRLPSLVIERSFPLMNQSISGSGRRPIKALARKLQLVDVDRPGPQCRLQDPGYTARLDDLLVHQADADFADIELLSLGRHYRLHRQAKAIIGRHAADNEAIAEWHARHQRGQLFVPANFQGATVLFFGAGTEEVNIALSLSASRKSQAQESGFEFIQQGLRVLLAKVENVSELLPLTSA